MNTKTVKNVKNTMNWTSKNVEVFGRMNTQKSILNTMNEYIAIEDNRI